MWLQRENNKRENGKKNKKKKRGEKVNSADLAGYFLETRERDLESREQLVTGEEQRREVEVKRVGGRDMRRQGKNKLFSQGADIESC